MPIYMKLEGSFPMRDGSILPSVRIYCGNNLTEVRSVLRSYVPAGSVTRAILEAGQPAMSWAMHKPLTKLLNFHPAPAGRTIPYDSARTGDRLLNFPGMANSSRIDPGATHGIIVINSRGGGNPGAIRGAFESYRPGAANGDIHGMIPMLIELLRPYMAAPEKVLVGA